MIDGKIIEITKHATERLAQRVVGPMIRGAHKEFLFEHRNAKKALYSMVNKDTGDLSAVEDKYPAKGGVFYDMNFSSYDGEIPVRILVRDNDLVTIWPLGKWRRVQPIGY